MDIEKLINFFNTYLNCRSSLFWRNQKRELQEFAHFFDTIESHPLTKSQRKAAILNEKRNLVVAGAGTGKTSVIIAKAGYLIKSGKYKPEDILLLAFNAPAAKEMEERCLEKLGVEIKAKTFHSLGKEILDTVEGTKSSVSDLATNEKKFEQFLNEFILELRNDPKLWKELKYFIIGKLKPYKPEGEFQSLSQYKSYVKNVDLRTLSGEVVKSFAELDIANFLFMKGVNYKYEEQYKGSGVKYQPDFYFPDEDIYLEHFGISRDGSTAPYIDAKHYNDQIKWKRKHHKENGTKLIETYSYQRFEGNLLEKLNSLLQSSSIKYTPRTDEEVFKALVKNKYTNQIGTLLKVFLAHFKSNQMSIKDLKKRARLISDDGRTSRFVELFSLFYERYEAELVKGDQEIDFIDMIVKSTKHIAEARYEPPWKYIIVDEFQDISLDRYKLVEAMLKKNPPAKFFAVGDDWQSINRFAGSDISIMSKFRKYFGRAAIVNLDRTFRFNDKIAELSGQFIQKNPAQLKKKLVTHVHEEDAQVYLHHANSKGNKDKILKSVIENITENAKITDDSLLVLGRYNHLLEGKKLKQTLEKFWPGEVLAPQSIHRSKGKEADYVIVLGLDASQFGFPSEIADDPLLSLVLAEEDSYPHAEERRLFYVAVTRAKKQAHLVYDEKNPSVFITELIEEDYPVHYLKKENETIEQCPECKSGQIMNNGEDFYTCSNFPYCHYQAPSCQSCDEGHMVFVKDPSGSKKYICDNDECRAQADVCPKCGIGSLIKKEGKFGEFWACHMWPRCSYTKNIKKA